MTFEEFEKISSKQWKQKIQFELDGNDFNSNLIWKSIEGIDVRPFYHNDSNLDPVSIHHQVNSWSIGQAIYVNNEVAANKKAIHSLKNGAENLLFILPNSSPSLSVLLKNIDFKKVSLYFEPLILESKLIKKFEEFFSNKSDSIFVINDAIGQLGRSGNWHHNMNKDFELLSQNFKKLNHLKSVISVDTSLYQNAGASMVQQLAYGLAHANEYLNMFSENISKTMVFKFAVGGNYFFEIAKLQAFRILWKSLMLNNKMNIECQIISSPTKRNKTIYDFNVNLLRTTTEIMSAALGSSDVIINTPYDSLYRKTNNFSDRLALNQLLILKKESHFDRIKNPTEGAYYIEYLTKEFAQKALLLFKNIEKEGGFLKQLKTGTIQRKIATQAQKEQQLYENKSEGLVGIHIQPHLKSKIKDQLELYPFLKKQPRKTLIEPIIEKRIAESIEKNRLEYE